MPEHFEIREIGREDAAWKEIEELFKDMYSYMSEHGLRIALAEGGAGKWVASVKKGLGRFGILFMSFDEDVVSGFAHGSIRLTPDYLGNKKTGVITHIHLKEEHRRKGAGLALVKALEKWFSEQQVHSIELQVLDENLPGIAFWEKLGYACELRQYRKPSQNI